MLVILDDNILNEFEIAPIASEEEFKEYVNSGKAKAMSDKIQKMLSSPDKVKRSELLGLTHDINFVHKYSHRQDGLKQSLMGYERMSGDLFPFSWHEVIKGEKIEKPFVSKYSIDEIQGRVKKAKNSEMEFLIEKISGIN